MKEAKEYEQGGVYLPKRDRKKLTKEDRKGWQGTRVRKTEQKKNDIFKLDKKKYRSVCVCVYLKEISQ